uniref:Alba domain-containing protein n=1 Tax=Heterorhabditis bacteriophora TaxID=37862 RepID=A0A1I7XCW0_HETBA
MADDGNLNVDAMLEDALEKIPEVTVCDIHYSNMIVNFWFICFRANLKILKQKRMPKKMDQLRRKKTRIGVGRVREVVIVRSASAVLVVTGNVVRAAIAKEKDLDPEIRREVVAVIVTGREAGLEAVKGAYVVVKDRDRRRSRSKDRRRRSRSRSRPRVIDHRDRRSPRRSPPRSRLPGPERRDVMPFTARNSPPKDAKMDMTAEERDQRTLFILQVHIIILFIQFLPVYRQKAYYGYRCVSSTHKIGRDRFSIINYLFIVVYF